MITYYLCTMAGLVIGTLSVGVPVWVRKMRRHLPSVCPKCGAENLGSHVYYEQHRWTFDKPSGLMKAACRRCGAVCTHAPLDYGGPPKAEVHERRAEGEL